MRPADFVSIANANRFIHSWFRRDGSHHDEVPGSHLRGCQARRGLRRYAPSPRLHGNALLTASGTAGSFLRQSFGTRRVCWCRRACRVQRDKGLSAPGSQKQPPAQVGVLVAVPGDGADLQSGAVQPASASLVTAVPRRSPKLTPSMPAALRGSENMWMNPA
jgi:hypothetical protein